MCGDACLTSKVTLRRSGLAFEKMKPNHNGKKSSGENLQQNSQTGKQTHVQWSLQTLPWGGGLLGPGDMLCEFPNLYPYNCVSSVKEVNNHCSHPLLHRLGRRGMRRTAKGLIRPWRICWLKIIWFIFIASLVLYWTQFTAVFLIFLKRWKCYFVFIIFSSLISF